MREDEMAKTHRRGAAAKWPVESSRTPDRSHVAAVLERAHESGLTAGRSSRISGRVSPELIARAKTRTGIESDTALVEFALANIAVEDDFARVFRDVRGTVDPELEMGF